MFPLTALVACLATGAGAFGEAALPRTPAEDAAELRQLTQQRLEANGRNDRAFYERLLAPNFLMLEPHRFPPHDKRSYLDLEFPAGRPPRAPATFSDFRALVDGGGATVSYEVVERYPLGGGQFFEYASRRLETYVRQDGAWRLVSMAVAEPPSWPDVAAVDPALYAEYSGTYQLAPQTLIVVSHESGRLMAQMTGQEESELLPESPTRFFDRNDSPLARTVFERDASGKVVAQVYTSHGRKVRAVKIR